MDSNIVKNFRDVGKFLNTATGSHIFPEHILYRGGSINGVFNHSEILNIPTIISLRKGADEKKFDCHYLHIPVADKVENYETSNGKVRRWVNQVISIICQPDVRLPILIHCTSGKDRTGVIVAAILLLFEIPESLIIQEYLASKGVDDPRLIKQAIHGFGNIKTYLNKVKDSQLLINKFYDANYYS